MVVSALSVALRNFENGVAFGPVLIPPRPGLREVGLAFVMVAILLLQPRGLTRGQEVASPGTKPAQIHSQSTDVGRTKRMKETNERNQVS